MRLVFTTHFEVSSEHNLRLWFIVSAYGPLSMSIDEMYWTIVNVHVWTKEIDSGDKSVFGT